MASLKQLVIRGSLWTVGSYVLGQVLRFASNLVLTRLLVPEMFGLMALGNILVLGLQLFSDIGIGVNIIQSKRGDDPDFLNTAWTIQILRGTILWLAALLLAIPAASFYNEPRLLWLIPILGFSTVISGLNSTASLTLNRKMAMGRLMVFEFAGHVISIVVTVIWATLNPTIWALVGGVLTSEFIRMVWSHRLIPGFINRLFWERKAAVELISFGKWIFLSTAFTFLASQADRLILGKLFSLELLGVYGIAFALAEFLRLGVAALSGRVMYPAYAKLSELPRFSFRSKILKYRRPVLLAALSGLVLLVCGGDLLVQLLYDKRYVQASWMLPILALGVWPGILFRTSSFVLIAIGRPNYETYGNCLKLLVTIITIPLAFHYGGILGAIIAVSLNELPLYAISTYGLWREKVLLIDQDLKLTLLFLAVLAIALSVRFSLGYGLPLADLTLPVG